MNRVNLRRFEFDYDTTWTAFFLDADLNVYSRYGGRDAGEPEDRMSRESLLHTMREVLEAHDRRPAAGLLQKRGAGLQPAAPRQEGLLLPEEPVHQPVAEAVFTPEDIPLLRKSHQGCLHCHQVREYQLLQWSHDGAFDRRKLFSWPLPEGVGLEFDRDHGHRIEKTAPGSAADRAGLLPGDVIRRVNDVPIRSEYDVRWALDRAADDAPLRIVAVRPRPGGESLRIEADLRPEGNWRHSDLGWRKSLRSVPLPLGFTGYAMTPTQRDDEGLGRDVLAIRVIAVRPRGLAESAGLEKGDIIIELDGRTAARTIGDFKSDLLRLHGPGDKVGLAVLRNGTRRKLTGVFPGWETNETSVP